MLMWAWTNWVSGTGVIYDFLKRKSETCPMSCISPPFRTYIFSWCSFDIKAIILCKLSKIFEDFYGLKLYFLTDMSREKNQCCWRLFIFKFKEEILLNSNFLSSLSSFGFLEKLDKVVPFTRWKSLVNRLLK